MKRLALTTAVVLSTLTAAFTIWELRGAAVLFMISLAVAAAALPVVETLVARRVPALLATLLAYSSAVLALGVLIFYTAGPLLIELREATDEVLLGCSRLKTVWAGGDVFERMLAERLPSAEPTTDRGTHGGIAVEALGLSLNVVETVGQSIFVLVLSIFWTANRESFERLWLSLLPADVRAPARNIYTEIRTSVGAEIRRELIQSLLAIALLDIGFHAMGLDYPTIPAFAGGLLSLLPLVGQCLAVLAAVVAGLSTSPTIAALAGTYTLALLFLLDALLAPRLVGARRHGPFLVTLTVFALGDAYGIAGLLAAPAVAATIQALLAGLARALGRATSAADLDARMEKLQLLVVEVGDAKPPHLESILQRLARLVTEAEDAATS